MGGRTRLRYEFCELISSDDTGISWFINCHRKGLESNIHREKGENGFFCSHRTAHRLGKYIGKFDRRDASFRRRLLNLREFAAYSFLKCGSVSTPTSACSVLSGITGSSILFYRKWPFGKCLSKHRRAYKGERGHRE